jgi:hypothetical protein
MPTLGSISRFHEPVTSMVMNRAEHEQLIQQLDQRQDDVLERLDELDHQIARLIEYWTQKRSPELDVSSQTSFDAQPDSDWDASDRAA